MAGYARNKMFFALSTILMLGLASYVTHRLLFVIDIPFWFRNCLIAVVFISSQSISFMRFVVTVKPSLSFRWLRLGGYVSALFMTLISVVIIRDVILLVIWCIQLFFSLEIGNTLFIWLNSPQADGALLGGSVFFAAYGMWSALRVPRIHELSVPMPHLPEALEGLRIAHLSDLHVGSTFDALWLRDVVVRTNAMDADLVLITGDLVDGMPSVLGEDMKLLTQLTAEMGVLISVGNHEYYSGIMPWVNRWRAQGLTVLLNEHRVFEKNGALLVVAGVADPDAKKFPGLVMPDPVAAKAGAPKAFSILMAHQPKEAAMHAALGYDLQLSGHTHGGQYFFLFPLISWMNKGFRSGLYSVGDMKMYVSPGTGLWGYVPMRVGSPSEITILTLVRA